MANNAFCKAITATTATTRTRTASSKQHTIIRWKKTVSLFIFIEFVAFAIVFKRWFEERAAYWKQYAVITVIIIIESLAHGTSFDIVGSMLLCSCFVFAAFISYALLFRVHLSDIPFGNSVFRVLVFIENSLYTCYRNLWVLFRIHVVLSLIKRKQWW